MSASQFTSSPDTPPRRSARLAQNSADLHNLTTDDDGDSGMEYELLTDVTDTSTTDNPDLDGEDTETEELAFVDAEDTPFSESQLEEVLNEIEEIVEVEEDGAEGTAEASGSGTAGAPAEIAAPMSISRTELFQLLHQSGWRNLIWHVSRGRGGANEDEELDSDDEPRSAARGHRRAQSSTEVPPAPSEKGQELMESGVFGTNERNQGSYTRKKQLAAHLMRRELGVEPPGRQRSTNRIASQGLIPSSNADKIINYEARCYSGQFSDDGNFFFSCSQDFAVRMYDTSNPYNWKYYRTVDYPHGQWTITDASLSPDNKFLAYSSIRSVVCLAPTDQDQGSSPYLLDFSRLGRRGGYSSHGHFGIWSIRFSGDGREIVAGTSDHSVYVYDLETRQSILKISGHDDEVNAVCFGDRSSPHLLYSGSDDSTLKVWDRRSLGDQREAGVFIGHTEGLTYVDSKGDGRYVLSNAKDQTMKLWDLRKMISPDRAQKIDVSEYSTGFDYRFQTYDRRKWRPNPHDCSLVTFRGHRVLKTLIRCHFSPPGSTDSRYVYTGSEDGAVYIYNLDATLEAKVNVKRATMNTRARRSEDSEPFHFYGDRGSGQRWKTCVRDASWHPNAPIIAATSWNSFGMTKGTCTVHTWNDGLDEDEGEPGMGQRVNAELEPCDGPHDTAHTSIRPRAHRGLRQTLFGSNDDDD